MMENERNLFAELKQSVQEMKLHKAQKITLRNYYVEKPKKLVIDASTIVKIRKKLHLSQSLFARLFRVSKRTLEKWEQGKTTPNEQATALILLIKKNPSLLEQLSEL